MQNAQIWKSIESLCDEAESVIKNSESVITVIKSIAPPAIAHRGKNQTNTSTILSSKPPPPKANLLKKPTQKENLADAPLSPATMAEIAAAINRAGQNLQKPQIMENPPRAMNDQLHKDLMIEVSLAVRSVLANELPKMVRHAISESLYELINSSTNPNADNLGVLEAKPQAKNEKKKTAKENNRTSVSAADFDSMSKRELEDLGREYGIELDRRYKKSTLVEQMRKIIEQYDLDKLKTR